MSVPSIHHQHLSLPGEPATLTALLVDDDAALLDVLEENLSADRFSVMRAASAEEALTILASARPDVAVLDVGLPGMSGFELVSAIRHGRDDGGWDIGMPILLLSGRDDSQSAVRAIERGADDYLVKPFHYPELLARMGAVVRRARGVTLSGLIRVGPLEVDRRGLSAVLHGRVLDLSAKEFGLLAALARDPRRVVSKQELLREVWGYASGGRTRTVDSHASRLRGKLSRAGGAGWVRNVWGQGYRLLPEER